MASEIVFYYGQVQEEIVEEALEIGVPELIEMYDVEVSVENLPFANGRPALALSHPVVPVMISLDASD